VTTSGTAVANLLPAVLEAHHAGVPLLIITADRPPELRGIGANQATVQPGIFATAVRWQQDVQTPDSATEAALAAAAIARSAWLGSQAGPAHLNVGFRNPLSGPALPVLPEAAAEPVAASDPGEVIELVPAVGTVVIAGADAGPIAEESARALGAPLMAEVSSGAHFGPNLVVAYRTLLAEPEFGDAVQRAIVFGHPTLSRQVPAVLQRDGVEVIVVRGTGADDYNPGRRARIVDGIRVTGPIDSSTEGRAWLGRWVHTSRALRAPAATGLPPATEPQTPITTSRFARAELAASRASVTREDLTEAVWRLTWPHDRLVLGSSRLIRVADDTVPGKRITVHANRGLAGIDGTIATALGVAIESQRPENPGATGITRVLLGDLAALHDSGALQLVPGAPVPRIQVIVGNDGGGTIFDTLEVAGTAAAADVDRVLYTPQAVDFAGLAAAYGWEYRRAANRGELEQVLTAPTAGAVLIEVPLAR